MPVNAILFDLDGTLLDTLSDIGRSANRVLSDRGFPCHEIDAYRQFIGNGAAVLMARALPEDQRSDETIRNCLAAFKEDYGQHWNENTAPYPGIPELLDLLTKRGLKMAVLSNKPHDFTVKCVTELLSEWKFDVVIGQQASRPRKPHPAGALEVAKRLLLPPSDFLYLGDSGVDMKTAIASGMLPVGACWGFRSAKELRKSGGRILIHHPKALPEHLS